MNLARVLLVLFALSLHITAPIESSASTQEAKATVLFAVEIERGAAETKVHLKADGAIKDYSEVKLKKNVAAHRPDRMYLDVKNVRLAGPIPAKKVGTALSKVRVGPRADGVRVVFDSNLDGLFHYTISEQPDGLLVTIRETSTDMAVIPPPIPVDKAMVLPAAVAVPVVKKKAAAKPENVIAPAVATMQPEPKAAGDLNLLIVTAETPEQTQEWLDRSPDRKMGLQIMKRAKPDQEINTSFLVTGVTPDSNGDFSVSVSFALLDPNGKVVHNERSFAKVSGRAPMKPAFIMAEPTMGIILSESDPAGEYKIIGIVEDLTNNKMFRTSIKVTLGK